MQCNQSTISCPKPRADAHTMRIWKIGIEILEFSFENNALFVAFLSATPYKNVRATEWKRKHENRKSECM